MKNKLLLFPVLLTLFFLSGCKDNSKIDENSTTQEVVETSTIEAKHLQLGNNKLIYSSQYNFVVNTKFTQELLSLEGVTDAAYYNLGLPQNQGLIGVSYQKLINEPNVNGAINGILGGYESIPGVSLTNETLNDVSKKYGVNAKLGRGNIGFSGENTLGEYGFLILVNPNEIIMIQGLFEQAGTKDVENFFTLLHSLELK